MEFGALVQALKDPNCHTCCLNKLVSILNLELKLEVLKK